MILKVFYESEQYTRYEGGHRCPIDMIYFILIDYDLRAILNSTRMFFIWECEYKIS